MRLPKTLFLTLFVCAALLGQNYTPAGSIPQVVSAGNWDTSLTFVNLDIVPGNAEFNFFANDGTTLALPFTFPLDSSMGTVTASSFPLSLAAGATVVLDTTGPDSATPTIAWSQVLTTGNINGFAIFTDISSGQAAVAPLESRNASAYLLAYDNTGELETGVAIANLANTAANVNVVIRNDAGTQIGTGSISLQPLGHNSFMLPDPTYGFPVTAGVRGTVEFDTTPGGQISVLGLRANGAALTSLPVMADVGTTGGTMAQLASGGGWQTVFTLVNNGNAPATATLNFFGNEGNALIVPLNFPQTGRSVAESSASQTIPAGATLLITTQGNSADTTVAGSAQLTTSGNISGFAIFQYQASGQTQIQEAVVPLETGSVAAYTLAFDNTNELATGVAVADNSGQSATVPVTLRDASGATIGTSTINLPANGHTSLMLTDANLFPVSANIRGTVEFDVPLDGQIGVLGIRATPSGAFTTIPVMSTAISSPSGSTTGSQVISTLALASSVNPSIYAQSVTFTATVSPSSATGNVTFSDGSSTLGTAALNGSGVATLSTSNLSVGAHSITAAYAGDANFAPSNSGQLLQNVNRANTTLGLGSSVNPSIYAQSVTFTATVSPSSATGTVTFSDGSSTLGTAALNGSGVATFSTSSLGIGAHSITAAYAGDTNFASSSSGQLSQNVNIANTTLGLGSSVNPSIYAQSVTFTATVSPSSATGNVTFSDGSSALGTAALNGGVATFSTSSLSVGAHSITAAYAGNANFAPSSSGQLLQNVKTSTTVLLGSSVNPSASGQLVTFTATVLALVGGTEAPTGTVTFADTSTLPPTTLGTAGLNTLEQATISTSALAPGLHTISATYSGDNAFAPGTSAPLSQVVTP